MINLKRTLVAGLTTLSLGAVGSAFAQDTFKVGMDITYPPFESYEGDKVVGFDPEVAALLGEKMNMTPEFIDSRFASLVLGLKSNKFDAVISGMYILPERLKVADAIPYARTGASIIVPKGSASMPKNEKGLCGMKVGLLQGESWVKELHTLSDSYCKTNGLPAITVQEFPSAPEVLQALFSGNVDAQLVLAGAAKLLVEKTKDRVQISSTELVYPQTIGIFVNKNNKEFKAKIEKALAEITKDGSFPKVLDKYELLPASK
jgi:polar amino acid transport system substrate-binding protein